MLKCWDGLTCNVVGMKGSYLSLKFYPSEVHMLCGAVPGVDGCWLEVGLSTLVIGP